MCVVVAWKIFVALCTIWPQCKQNNAYPYHTYHRKMRPCWQKMRNPVGTPPLLPPLPIIEQILEDMPLESLKKCVSRAKCTVLLVPQ